MSDKDKPANPFGRGERTIIRPNPGGRLPQGPSAYPPAGEPLPAQSSPLPRAPFSPTPLPGGPASSYTPQPQGYAAPPTTPATEEWIATPPAQAPQAAPLAGPVLWGDALAGPEGHP